MTNESTETTHADQKLLSYGARLRTAREALGIERKDAAAQLRLNETVISMLEKDHFPDDLPIIFVRGYMRSYGKFLQIPDCEIKSAVEPIKLKLANEAPAVPAVKPQTPLTSSNYIMQFITYAVALTLLALVAAWWYNHNSSPNSKDTDKAIGLPLETDTLSTVIPEKVGPVLAAPQAPTTQATHDAIRVPLAPTSSSPVVNQPTQPSIANTPPSPVPAYAATPVKAAKPVSRSTDDDSETDENTDTE